MAKAQIHVRLGTFGLATKKLKIQKSETLKVTISDKDDTLRIRPLGQSSAGLQTDQGLPQISNLRYVGGI